MAAAVRRGVVVLVAVRQCMIVRSMLLQAPFRIESMFGQSPCDTCCPCNSFSCSQRRTPPHSRLGPDKPGPTRARCPGSTRHTVSQSSHGGCAQDDRHGAHGHDREPHAHAPRALPIIASSDTPPALRAPRSMMPSWTTTVRSWPRAPRIAPSKSLRWMATRRRTPRTSPGSFPRRAAWAHPRRLTGAYARARVGCGRNVARADHRHEGPVWQVEWAHPKFGVLLASCSYDGRVIIHREAEPKVWTTVWTFTGHKASGAAAA